MNFYSRGRGRGAIRGRGRGVGEVAFEPRSSHSQGSNPRDSHHDQGPPAESLRITVGNDQFRDRGDNISSSRLGPPRDRESYERDRPQSSSRDEDIYRREADVYAHAERDRLERSRDFDRRGSFERDPYSRPEERDYGDRRGIGASVYDKPAQSYSSLAPSKAPLFPAASRSPPRSYKEETQSASSLSQSSGGGSRPLKSILKKKPDPVIEEKPEKPTGLPGIASYMDDIEDEDKFLYGGDDERRNNDQGSRETGQYGHQPRGVPIEDMRATNIRSAAQSWKPSAPLERTVSGVVAEFVSAQREYTSSSIVQQQPMYNQPDLYQSQPAQASLSTNDSGGNDLWTMLAKSVQTVQQQQQIPQNLPVSFPQSFNVPPAQPAFPAQENPMQAVSHDPTIENILKSIGFDFEMSKRMQEKAKQGSGEVTVPTSKPGEPEFIDQTASFIGSQFSHEEMVSQLRPSRDLEPVTPERETQRRDDERRQESYPERSRREGSEASRGRMRSPPRGQSPEQLQRGCSPVSAEGSPSPPPPMFNLPPITIKRRSVLDRRSPDWDKKKSRSRSPTRESDRNRKRSSKSPSWNRSISSYGRRSSRSPARKQSPSLPRNRSRTRSPPERAASPVIKRTFNLEGLSPAIRRKFSPGARQRSPSPALRNVSPEGKRRRSTSPDQWSPSNRRRSMSPGYRRSRSPGRRRSRSPVNRRSRSPRHYSPRRRSISPRGRKRGHSRSRSRERKMQRSLSREKRRRSSSRDRSRRRSMSRSRGRERGRGSRSPRSKRSVSLSSDSDVDGPANKMYFSSPLRLSSQQRREIPRFYDNPPPHSQGPPPDFSAPPPPMYATDPSGYPLGPPPGMFSIPPGAPPFGLPPPGMGPPPMMAPPPGYPFAVPGLPGMYGMPGPPMGLPSNVPMNPDDGPPGTMDMPLNLPTRPNLQVVEPELSKRETESPKEREKKTERRRSRSRSREKDRSTSARSREKSSSSHRTVLPPRPKAEDIEIVASTKSNERVVVIGGKATKMSSSSKSPKEEKREKKVDTEKEKTKIMKEKESMVAKIKALETEFNNLKKQEFDLQSRNVQDDKPDPILAENKKLLEEIKKEIVKLTKRKKDFEVRHAEILKHEISTKREIKISAKKTPTKDDKSKTGEKKEEFKVEKGKLMRHHFYDSGDHWCKPCNSVHSNIQDFMHHLASYKHKQTLPSDFRPWMDGYKANDGMIINKKGTRVALPGIEFLMPVSAYYCQLCKVFLGDVSMGADHFKCESHYINYKFQSVHNMAYRIYFLWPSGCETFNCTSSSDEVTNMKYLSDNPIYEKKYKEEREQSIKKIKAEMKVENEAKAKEQRKRSDSEKDARVRENEKKWDKTVEDLQDENTGSIKAESSKSQIKLNLKDQKSETGEKGFGKFTWNKDKKENEDTKNGEKTPDADQDKEKGKINFNISSSGKNIIGKTGAQKRNPLLPPWQPVGKKTETPGKLGETTSLDQFLTTNSGDGKIPVITEKKKISAKEILEAFEGKYKEKEEAAKEAAAKEAEDQTTLNDKKTEEKMEVSEEKRAKTDEEETKTDENKPKFETSEENKTEVVVDQPKSENESKEENKTESSAEVVVDRPKSEKDTKEENKTESSTGGLVIRQKSEKEIKEENEKRMMGIDPDSEIPLAEKKPPPPRSQNMPLPGQKPSATVDEKELHKVFHADTTDESEKPKTDIVDLKSIPFPDSTDESEKPKIDIVDLKIIPVPDSTDESEKPKADISTDESEKSKTDIVDLKSIPFPDSELPDDIFAPDSPVVKEETKTPTVIETEENVSVRSETETKAGENINVVKVELEFDSNVNKQMTLETETSFAVTLSENMMEVSSASQEVKPKETSSEKNGLEPMVVEIELGTGESEKEIIVHVESSDNVSEVVTNGKEKQTEEVVAVRKSKSRSREPTPKSSVPDEDIKEDEYGGETEEEEEEEPVPIQKGRGRGRGKRGGRGRGRGARGRGKSQNKSSRSLRSSKAVEVSIEIGDSETVKNNTDNVDSDENNKGLEVKSSVQIGKPTGSKKKTTSTRVRKTSMKSNRSKQDLEDISDDDDNLSLGSFGSVEMGSDFEIVDDIEDMDVLDEAL